MMGLPLTASTRRPRRSVPASAGVGWTGGKNPSFTVNQNIDPCPGVLSTPIAPPISSESCLAIASPRPVPPCVRVVEAST